MNRQELTERLRQIRVTNNDLWLKLLAIALECNPEETKKIMASISGNDEKVVEVFRALCKT